MKYPRKIPVIFAVLILLLLFFCTVSLAVGSIHFGVSELIDILLGSGQGMATIVVLDIRLPRMLLAALVGAGLGISGAVIQGLFRNPLAEPGLIGVSGGAALGAACVLVLGTGSTQLFSNLPLDLLLPAAAFIGGLFATLLVMVFAWSRMAFSITTMLLVGLALNTMATGGIGLLTALSDQDSLRNLTFWLLGSMAAADSDKVLISAVIIIPCICWLLRDAANLDCLLLGESGARALGVPVTRLKFRLVLLSALIVGTSVAFTGIIGFIGLIVPNLLRFLVGPMHRWLMPASAILGALILVSADLLARMVWFPHELPIGVLTSLLGGPIFIFLIGIQRKKGLL